MPWLADLPLLEVSPVLRDDRPAAQYGVGTATDLPLCSGGAEGEIENYCGARRIVASPGSVPVNATNGAGSRRPHIS